MELLRPKTTFSEKKTQSNDKHKIWNFIKKHVVIGKLKKEDIKKISEATSQSSTHILILGANEMSELIIFLEKNKNLIESIRKSLINYAIIRYVSLVENYFENHVRNIVDKMKYNPKVFFESDDITISLSLLDEIRKDKNFTPGNIIAEKINFQNLDNINSKMSNVYGLKYFDEIEMLSKKKHISTYLTKFKKKNLYELFRLRHEIIHKMKNADDVDLKKLRLYHATVMQFLVIAGILFNQEKSKRLHQRMQRLAKDMNFRSDPPIKI